MSDDPQISEWGNLHMGDACVTCVEQIGVCGEPPELKHLSRREEEKSNEIPRVVASESGRGQTGGSNTFGVADMRKRTGS